MDNKGFISIEYLFSIFVILIVAIPLLFLSQSAVESNLNVEDSVTHRLILDDVSNAISQVNSNGKGYSKSIYLTSDVGYYEITVENNKLTMDYYGKKAQSMLAISNFDSKYELHSGNSYIISKNDEGKLVIT